MTRTTGLGNEAFFWHSACFYSGAINNGKIAGKIGKIARKCALNLAFCMVKVYTMSQF
jgi:hypothetical protein